MKEIYKWNIDILINNDELYQIRSEDSVDVCEEDQGGIPLEPRTVLTSHKAQPDVCDSILFLNL